MQKLIRVICVFSTVLLLAGCTVPSDSGANPWHKEFADAKQRLMEQEQDGQFQINVLEDGVITKQESEEAQTKFVKCMVDGGYSGIVEEEHGVSYDAELVSDPEFKKVQKDCLAMYDSEVGALYINTSLNPNNEDPAQLTLDCMKRSGLVPDDYTLSEFKQVEEAYFAVIPVFEGEGESPKGFFEPIREPDVTFPNGLSWNDDKIVHCHVNPLGIAGFPLADESWMDEYAKAD